MVNAVKSSNFYNIMNGQPNLLEQVNEECVDLAQNNKCVDLAQNNRETPELSI